MSYIISKTSRTLKLFWELKPNMYCVAHDKGAWCVSQMIVQQSNQIHKTQTNNVSTYQSNCITSCCRGQRAHRQPAANGWSSCWSPGLQAAVCWAATMSCCIMFYDNRCFFFSSNYQHNSCLCWYGFYLCLTESLWYNFSNRYNKLAQQGTRSVFYPARIIIFLCYSCTM